MISTVSLTFWFSIRGWIGFWINGFAHWLWIFVVNQADSRILKKCGSCWISRYFWHGFWILSLSWCLDHWVLNEIWITVLSSALVGMVMSSSNFFFSNEAYLNSDVLHCICTIFNNNGIHMYVIYQFTIELLYLCFCMQLWFWIILTKILVDRQIWWKKAWIRGFIFPYSPPSSSMSLQARICPNETGEMVIDECRKLRCMFTVDSSLQFGDFCLDDGS